jgi:hypothetical protein
VTCRWPLSGLGYRGAIERRSSRVRDTVRIHGRGIGTDSGHSRFRRRVSPDGLTLGRHHPLLCAGPLAPVVK